MKPSASYEKKSDEALIVSLKEGDLAAFESLYDRYLDRVYRRVRAHVPREDVEDVTQEVFLAVVRSLATFRAASSFSTWVHSIINKKVADYYRRRHQVEMDNPAEGPQERPSGQAREREVMVKEILWRLPEHYRQIIISHLAEGISLQEIAHQEGSSLEGAKSLYRRALGAFKREWEKV